MAYKVDTLPSGSKRIRIYYTDADGKYRSKSVTAPTEKEVLRLAMDTESELKHHETQSGTTVGAAVKEYIELCRPVCSPSTVSKYEQNNRLYFDPIRDIAVDRISDKAVQTWINGLINKGLSPKTIKNIYALFLPAVKMHTDYEPRIRLPQTEEFIARIPTEEQMEQILSAVQGTEIELPVVLAACGGLRMSEITGLKWTDVKSDYIMIQRAKIYVDGERIVKKTKSTAGTRMLPVLPPIKAALDRTPRDGEYMITISERGIKSRYNTLLRSLGLPQYRFHDLRHHAASVGAKLGIPDQYMMQFIGHSTVKMLRHYQHQMKSATSEFADKLKQYYEK